MWKPGISFEIMQKRAEYLRTVREFFYEKNVLEVDVPILGAHTVTDPFVDSLSLHHQGHRYFLQTSPEYFLKRVLSEGSGDIYYLGKAFRDDVSSRLHHCEFTMLEWYRHDYDDRDLMQEVSALVQRLDPGVKVLNRSYQSLFSERFSVNPHTVSVAELQQLVADSIETDFSTEDRSTLFDMLFSHCIEPDLPLGLVLVCDYPRCQSALARIERNGEGHMVARRFEAFLNRTELANGYWELTNLDQQRERFQQDNDRRTAFGKPRVQVDTQFLAAIEHGLPDCAGVALGVDRLLMSLLNVDHISAQKVF